MLPDGYRGALTVELLLRPYGMEGEPRSRAIEVALSEARRVTIEATPLIYRFDILVLSSGMQARFASGERLPRIDSCYEAPTAVALRIVQSWWCGSQGPRGFLGAVYIVGDGAECRSLHEELHEPTPEGGVRTNITAIGRYFSRPIR